MRVLSMNEAEIPCLPWMIENMNEGNSSHYGECQDQCDATSGFPHHRRTMQGTNGAE